MGLSAGPRGDHFPGALIAHGQGVPEASGEEGKGGGGDGGRHLSRAALALAFRRGEISPREQQPKVRGVDGCGLNRHPHLVVCQGSGGFALQREREGAVVGKGAAQLKLGFAEGHGMLLDQPRRRVWGNLSS